MCWQRRASIERLTVRRLNMRVARRWDCVIYTADGRTEGRSSTVKICFPVHISSGLITAGGGRSTRSAPSPRYAASRANCDTCGRAVGHADG